ncbi:ABC transporter permease [Kutzneria viridogrisea]|uniref:ABC transporter permease n=2 Tax=Kutzneria TaxID=43356 RepID=W5WMK8_9PSEU|nr:ABC transporter permease [Kutzneria albida]AHI02093.1 hypothetical protein KALB_8736 [Kutzneria albida DSM 43870]MBA8929346.1 ABC-2 type transport system permease protein [Kutzneria viridogrisea]
MRLLNAERIKLLSTRSTWWCALLAVALPVLFALFYASQAGDFLTLNVGTTQSGYQFGLVLVMVLATVSITSEHRFGTIRGTYQAVPSRVPVLLAKAVLLAVLAGLIGELAAFGSLAMAHLVQPEVDLAVNTATEWREVAGVGLVYAVAAVLALAVGELLRQTAGAVALLLGYVLLAESAVREIPGVGEQVARWLPFFASRVFLGSAEGEDATVSAPYGPWAGLGLFAGTTLVLLALAAVVARRRDA